MTVQDARNQLERKKGEKSRIEKDLAQAEKNEKYYTDQSKRSIKAREVLNQFSIFIKKRLQYKMSQLTTLAFEAVFDDPYQLVVEFVQRRNKTECDIYFDYHGNPVDPRYGGGGARDIASFALRIASLSMQRPQPRNVLALDEPFRHLKGKQANKNALQMVKEISSQPEINTQVIMVSDERAAREETMDVADRLFEFSLVNGVTHVKQLK